MNTYHPPKYKADAFNCPFCSAYAQMNWLPLVAQQSFTNIWQAKCARCGKKSYWHTKIIDSKEFIIYPKNSNAPIPHPDMPKEILQDYNEAREIVDVSPRAASALLRLVIQKLCVKLGGKGEKINDDIEDLVAKGLPVKIQQALDIVRVIGNESVHPGTMHPDDIAEVAYSLFDLVNIIVEYMVAIPKKTEELFNNLPESKIKAIEKRDGKT